MRIGRRAAMTLTLGALAMTLAACSSGGSGYSSPEDLKSAYVDAGGTCENGFEAGEDMLSEGAHGIICESMTILIVFDSEDAKNRYLARTGSSESYTVGGDRWLALGEDKDVLDKLGGSSID